MPIALTTASGATLGREACNVVTQRHLVKFRRSERPARSTGAVNPHKGAEPAVSFYSDVSNPYAPFHSNVISASASEAAQVGDGLLHHGADLDIEEHHVDGGGVSEHVFAFYDLLGFQFARVSRTSPRAVSTCSRAWNPVLISRRWSPADRSRLDRLALERCPASGIFDPHRSRQRIDHAGTARFLSARQRSCTRIARDRPRRAHPVPVDGSSSLTESSRHPRTQHGRGRNALKRAISSIGSAVSAFTRGKRRAIGRARSTLWPAPSSCGTSPTASGSDASRQPGASNSTRLVATSPPTWVEAH